jgi:hypothetical protein
MRRRPHEASPAAATTVSITLADFFMGPTYPNSPAAEYVSMPAAVDYFGVKVDSTPKRL